MQISMGQSDTEESPKCQNGPLDVTLEEKALLEFVKNNPKTFSKDGFTFYVAQYLPDALASIDRMPQHISSKRNDSEYLDTKLVFYTFAKNGTL